MSRRRWRKVIGRERALGMTSSWWLRDGVWQPGWASRVGRDVLECYHDVTLYGSRVYDASKRLCNECGGECDCHLCRRGR